tara:strand:+ start:1072 stop:2052 length:981 start_codon:yes stop_codon:yes gene_type:complete
MNLYKKDYIYKGIPFTEKYRPIEAKEVCGCDKNYDQLCEAMEKPKCLLIHGPPGTGKTSSIRTLIKEKSNENIFFFDMSLKASEINKNISRILLNFIQKQTISKHKIIIVDEVDCMRVTDQRIFKMILTPNTSSNRYMVSVIFICNNIERVSDFIVRKCEVLKFDTLNFSTVSSYLINICEKENIPYDIRILERIFGECDFDLRKTITLIQYIYMMSEKIDNSSFEEIVLKNRMDSRYIEDIFKMEIISGVNKIYYEGISINNLISELYDYHIKNNVMNEKYLNTLAFVSSKVKKTNDIWYLIYYLLFNSPLNNSLSVSKKNLTLA